MDLLTRLERELERFFGINPMPAPIAPEAHQAACLRDACECCADPQYDVPEEAK